MNDYENSTLIKFENFISEHRLDRRYGNGQWHPGTKVPILSETEIATILRDMHFKDLGPMGIFRDRAYLAEQLSYFNIGSWKYQQDQTIMNACLYYNLYKYSDSYADSDPERNQAQDVVDYLAMKLRYNLHIVYDGVCYRSSRRKRNKKNNIDNYRIRELIDHVDAKFNIRLDYHHLRSTIPLECEWRFKDPISGKIFALLYGIIGVMVIAL